jgi:processive 1,2-diacylglycerol beta-glucosyltransferase/1,2-diacylglycerol 3-beta-galactosyltransferase
MEFVRDNELGIFERNIAKLPSIIQELVSDEERYQRYIKNIEKMSVRSGTEEVGEFLREME